MALLDSLGTQGEQLRSLQHCTTAGEPLTHRLRAQFQARLPWVRLWNNYGCTELNDITYAHPQEQNGGSLFVSIGRPIANTRVYVLDSDLRPVPPGAIGELYVHSIGAAYGYWRQHALTAESFVADPFSRTPGHACIALETWCDICPGRARVYWPNGF